MHDACMVRYVDLVVRRLGNPKQRAKSLGNHLGERLGKLFGRDRIGKAPANVVAVVFVTPARRMNGADAHSDPRWLGAAAIEWLTAGRSVSPRFVLTPYRLRNRR